MGIPGHIYRSVWKKVSPSSPKKSPQTPRNTSDSSPNKFKQLTNVSSPFNQPPFKPALTSISPTNSPTKSQIKSPIKSPTKSPTSTGWSPFKDLRDIEDSVPLQKFKKKGALNVTDLSSQLWCEKQLEFTLITGKKRFTKAMKAGIDRHETLELLDHEIIDVEVETKEDNLGVRLLNAVILLEKLIKEGKSREVWIFGSVDGVILRGIIDELEVRHAGPYRMPYVVVTDTKTRANETVPSDAQKRTSAIQLQLYRWMLNELRDGRVSFDLLFDASRCSSIQSFSADVLKQFGNLEKLATLLQKVASNLPPIADYSEVVYESASKIFHREHIPYNENSTLHSTSQLLNWWKGRRESDAVLISEKWKCRWCDFVETCVSTPLTKEEIQAVQLKRKLQEEEEEKKLRKEEEELSKSNQPSNPSYPLDMATIEAQLFLALSEETFDAKPTRSPQVLNSRPPPQQGSFRPPPEKASLSSRKSLPRHSNENIGPEHLPQAKPKKVSLSELLTQSKRSPQPQPKKKTTKSISSKAISTTKKPSDVAKKVRKSLTFKQPHLTPQTEGKGSQNGNPTPPATW